MKIVQINETCGIGSTGRTTQELATGITNARHEAFVFYASGNPTLSHCIRIGNALDHKAHALLSRLTGKQGYFSKLATLHMLKQLDSLKPDVVHLRNLHGNYINLGMLLRYLAAHDIPTVLTLHDCWFMTGKCTYYVSANCKKWQTECGNCPLLHIDNMNPTWFFDRSRKCFLDKKRWFQAIPRLGVVGVSHWVRDEAKQSIFKERQPITIYNWIDRDVFYPRETKNVKEKYGLRNAFMVLMVTSQVAENKGFGVLTALADRLGESCQFVLVGRNNLNLPIPSNIRYISHTNDANELAALYSAADVCVNTTAFETFGKVTAEALCCGTPVIVYNNTASPELVGPNCGYVVEQEDGVETVLEAVKKIMQHGKAAYKEDCLSFSKQKFAKETGIGQYLNLYRQMVRQ